MKSIMAHRVLFLRSTFVIHILFIWLAAALRLSFSLLVPSRCCAMVQPTSIRPIPTAWGELPLC